MTFSLIIAACIVVALVVYFVLSKKFRTPTITTEILIKKYNSKLKKLERFFKKNKIELDVQMFESRIEKKELNVENLKQSLSSIQKVNKNSGTMEEIFLANSVKEVEEKYKLLEKDCVIFEFQDELDWDQDVKQVLQMLDFSDTKLDFEQQRYFGSQNFYKIEDKLIFVINSLALVVNPKNAFEANFSEFNLITEKMAKKGEKNAPFYKIMIKTKGLEYETELIVPQKEGRKLLDKFKKNSA